MHFKISFSNDDRDLIDAIEDLVRLGYSPQGATRKIMRDGLCPANQNGPANVNISFTLPDGSQVGPYLAPGGADQVPPASNNEKFDVINTFNGM